MAIELRQSTAGQEIPLGHFLSATDGDTEMTALTIVNTDILIWKYGATVLVPKNAGGASHMQNAVYSTVLDATDTDTIGGLTVFVHVATALAVKQECRVLLPAEFDAKYTGTLRTVNATQLAGSEPGATSLAAGANQLATFTVGASPTAVSIPTDITGVPYSNDNHFEGRVVTINQETRRINASSGSPVVLTVDVFNSVPAQNDPGVIS